MCRSLNRKVRASCEPLIEELSKRISNEHPSRVDRPSNPTNTHRSEHSTKMYQISINCTIQTNRRSNEDPTNIYQRSNEHLPNMYRKPYIDHPPKISRSPIEHITYTIYSKSHGRTSNEHRRNTSNICLTYNTNQSNIQRASNDGSRWQSHGLVDFASRFPRAFPNTVECFYDLFRVYSGGRSHALGIKRHKTNGQRCLPEPPIKYYRLEVWKLPLRVQGQGRFRIDC